MLDEIFKSLSEMTRLRILSLLINQEMCVCEIECTLKLTQSNASRHLTTLRKSKILESYKNAQWTYYRIRKEFKEENKELWEYLSSRVIKLPTYNADISRLEDCKADNICCKQKPPH